jgi:undecaprenyl-diphosphatase
MMLLHDRIERPVLRRSVLIAIAVFTVFMLVGRFLSGVHWATDIVGGILLSGSLVLAYDCFRASEETDRSAES